jgi:nicotinamidase-related amidase
MAVYEPVRIGLLLIDTVNEIFSEGGKGYPNFKDEFERIGTRENIARLLAYARERDISVFFAPMSYTEEDYTSWKHLSGIHREMYDNRMFEAGSWGADFHPDLGPSLVRLLLRRTRASMYSPRLIWIVSSGSTVLSI